jgi:hypothetical protein
MPPDREFERELEELGAGIEYPPTPDLSRAVRNRLDEEGGQATSRGFWAHFADPRWAAAAAAILLIIAVPSLSPALRANIDEWLTAPQSASGGSEAAGGAGQPAEEKASDSSLAESGEDMPESGGAVPSSATPEAGGSRSPGEGLGLGEGISLKEARARTPGELLLPETPEVGEPDEVYAPRPSKDNGVALVYRARQPALPPLEGTQIGLILTERPGGVRAAYLAEGNLEQGGIERVNVRDRRGYWIPSGSGFSSAVHRTDGLHGNVLLWEQEGLALRMETSLPKKEAVRIAGSVR